MHTRGYIRVQCPHCLLVDSVTLIIILNRNGGSRKMSGPQPSISDTALISAPDTGGSFGSGPLWAVPALGYFTSINTIR